jgi:formylglycine-generating enzyme required for sulfatase activity
VTQAQWQAVMSTNPSHFQGEDRPVETVLWEDVQVFMQKLNEREGVSHYRLPTEAQWEYACRAGSNTIYHFGNDIARLGEYAWYAENANSQPHPVGQKQPNAWGLYDTHGNVCEWVHDWYGPYTADSITDTTGPDTGTLRVVRGGYWASPARSTRAATRLALVPGSRYPFFGFRCLSSGLSK